MSINISRLGEFNTYNCEIEIVTPMFLLGASGKTGEIRAPSIKGALRFWWRASTQIRNLDNMREKEDEIFGSTKNKSLFSIRVEHKLKPVLKNLNSGKTFPIPGRKNRLGIVHYLSYGLHTRNVFDKEHFTPGSRFKIFLTFSTTDKTIIDEVKQSLKLLITFGALGSRNRNGFGSLFSTGLDLTTDYVSNSLRNGTDRNYTGFSNNTRLFIGTIKPNWEDALSEIGLAYRTARLSISNIGGTPPREEVALPLGRNHDRYSKSYFLSINKVGKKFQGQILYLPVNEPAKSTVYNQMNTVLTGSLKRII